MVRTLMCPKCGSLMRLKVEKGKRMLQCPKCGHIQEYQRGSLAISRSITHTEREKLIVLETGQELRTLPIAKDVICPKCGYSEAYYWVMQTRRADEPPTRFYKCVKCGHVWREYE